MLPFINNAENYAEINSSNLDVINKIHTWLGQVERASDKGMKHVNPYLFRKKFYTVF